MKIVAATLSAFLLSLSMAPPPAPHVHEAQAAAAAAAEAHDDGEKIEFTDVKKQTLEFMGYYEDIELTSEQEAVKKEALGPLPAPCCSNNSAYTCCCVCNLSRTIWGLSHHLIAERGFDAEQTREAVVEWVRFISPNGVSGDACFRGGCMRSFADMGCGGMDPSAIIW